MPLQTKNPTRTEAWKSLSKHFLDIRGTHMKSWFEADPQRAKKMTLKWEDFYVDFSKNRIDEKTLSLLFSLAEELNLRDAIEKYFAGDKINQTEGRAVLHTALRAPAQSSISVDGENIVPAIYSVREKIKRFSKEIIAGTKKGQTEKPFTDVVNIGIGGSDLGPAMVVEALGYYRNHIKTHFVSNVDGDHVNETLKKINPETTLFIVVSKSFTTQETLSNADTIRKWFLTYLPREAIAKHFVAITANVEKAKNFGVAPDHIFPMWDWVGGRFSLWSAVGLSIALAVGSEHFERLLLGAYKMDVHFKNEPFNKNIPVVLSLLSVWYNNFFKAETQAIIPYAHYLNSLTPYLQQAMMESNGKGIDKSGDSIDYQSGNIVWGAPGTNAQHAFFQLMHQGTKLIPSDFIGFIEPLHGNKNHHEQLISNFIAQTEALMQGSKKEEQKGKSREESPSNPYKKFEGNKPSNTIFIQKLTPESLGKLIALYEHQIFVQGVIWNIFSFDQFGVELGKQLAKTLIKDFRSEKKTPHDTSTQRLMNHFLSSGK